MPKKNSAHRAFGSRYHINALHARQARAASRAYPITDTLEPTREQPLLAILPAMLFTSSPDGAWDYVNPPFCAYTGRPPEALTGMGWAAVLHEEDRDASLARWQAAIPLGAPFQSE